MMAINDYYVYYIIWNLILLIIPYFLCRKIEVLWLKSRFRSEKSIISAVFWAVLWILFIPNTAYVITDVRHLLNFCPENEYRVCVENSWMIMFFFTYASLGWVGFVYLLNQMKNLVMEICGKDAAALFVFLIIPVISLGVMLGLIERFNSWDFFIKPAEIMRSAFNYFIDFIRFRNLAAFIGFHYILYFAGDYLFRKKIQ